MYMDGGISFFDAFILLGNFHHANQMSRVKVVERGVPQMSVPLAPPPPQTPSCVGPYIRVESGGCLFHKCPHFEGNKWCKTPIEFYFFYLLGIREYPPHRVYNMRKKGKNEMPIEVGIFAFHNPFGLGGGKVPFHNVPSRYTRDTLFGCGSVLILVPAQINTDY